MLRPCDLDRSKAVWEYRPESHKTQHHGKERVICIGPKAQEVLLPYLLRPADTYCFSPAESEAKRHAKLRQRRRNPVQPSQQNRRKPRPKRKPADRYLATSYAHAIYHTIKRSNKAARKAAEQAGEDPEKAPQIPRWHPNQLRHSMATEVRRTFGLEAAQVVLGHSKADVTQVYAERDHALAASVIQKIG
jgi:integrase